MAETLPPLYITRQSLLPSQKLLPKAIALASKYATDRSRLDIE